MANYYEISTTITCEDCEETKTLTFDLHEMERECIDGCSGFHPNLSLMSDLAKVVHCFECEDVRAQDRANDHATRRAESGYAQ